MDFLLSFTGMNRLEMISKAGSAQSVDLEQLIAITNVPIFCVDFNGIIVKYNSEFAAVMGCNREEMLGKNVARVTYTCFWMCNF
jgi:transcriptional regulator with PAS, ATPase and Fis domain